ncbi:hypothetical protein DGI_3304 [Megalodesulfovibrio gigas DSM 1382 = ATCC 19364]|uniref:Uncharacterized protein n=1 Tax=Megalodesulfovibrio gigas (strain ATCC 19364 / DSM 1382 / NCIMB 9332 / VKM B-1759) TaxID=1121448 RepID=T2GEH1_MEGG1|nr:hypothetical protein DGI_3304 [Megalodesulfovibrio gigas DSM 1382 = ATCC 19364]
MKMARRIARLESSAEARKPIPPGLVLWEQPGGFRALNGRLFLTVAEAEAAFPECTLATIRVRTVDVSIKSAEPAIRKVCAMCAH